MKSPADYIILIATLLISSQTSATSQTTYTAKLIGENSRNSYFNAVAINDWGYATGQRNNAAYIWNPNTADFQALTWDAISYGLDINNHGQVVGYVGDSNSVMWTNGVGVALGNWRSAANKINNNGVSVGWQYNLEKCCWPQNATVWSGATNTMLSTDSQFLEAHSINDSGLVVGITSSRQLFTWNGQARIYEDVFVSGRVAVNESGVIAGNIRNTSYGGFILNGAGITVVPDIEISSISNSGLVFGYGYGDSAARGAIFLDETFTKREFRSLVIEGEIAETVNFSKAIDVNNRGQVLVEGSNTANGGNTQYYLLTPVSAVPEVSSFNALLGGIPVVLFLSLRARRNASRSRTTHGSRNISNY
jgi:hypothetical protein